MTQQPVPKQSFWKRLLGNTLGFSHVDKGLRSRWAYRRALSSFLLQGTSIGMQTSIWTDSRYEMVRQFKHWVYIAVDRIATEIAMHSPNVSLVRTPQDPGKKERYAPHHIKEKALTPLLYHQHLEPVRDEHPLLRLLNDPNEPDTAYDFWYETVLFLLLTGSAYWWTPLNELGLPMALWVLPSHWVWANTGKSGLIESYQVRPVEGNYVRMEIPAEEIIHFRKKSPISKLDGFSPQTAGAQWIDCQTSLDRSRWFAFHNGVIPGVVLEFEQGVKIPNDEILDRIEAKFMARFSGEMQSHRPMFLPPGMKWNKLNLTPQEMDFPDSAEQLRDQILALFGVPAVVAQIQKDMTYGSVLAARAGFYYSTVNPLYRFLGQTATEKLARRYDRRLKVWWEDRTPQDPEMVERSIQTDFSCAATTPNEIRRQRGKEPFPHGGDDPIVQGAMMTLPFVSGGEIISINSSPSPSTAESTKEDPNEEGPLQDEE